MRTYLKTLSVKLHISHFALQIFVFCYLQSFSFSLRFFFTIFYKTALILCLYRNIFISLSFWKNGFVGYRILDWWFFFSFRPLNISFYYLLVFIVSDKNPVVSLTVIPLDVMNHFAFTALKKSWKKKVCCGFLCIYLLTYFIYYIMPLCLYWYIDKFYLGFVELLTL